MCSTDDTRTLWRRTSHEWGRADCILSVADHILRVTGIDPAAPWRGTYDDEEGARRILAAHGGALGLFDYGMTWAGFDRTSDRRKGNPVVCQMGDMQIAGVDMGRRVMFRMERGVIECPAAILGAWAI